MDERKSVLIIQTAFIGDVILATALVDSIRSKFPDTKIDFLLRKGNEGLLEGHPLLRNVIIFNKSKKYSDLIRIIKTIRKSRYDYVINVQRFLTTGLITLLAGAKVTVGFDKNPLSSFFSRKVKHTLNELHEVQRNHQLIEFMVGKQVGKPRLYPSKANFEKVKPADDKPYLTISPASVWFTKQFPPEKWNEFLTVLPNEFDVYLLGAANDKGICNQIKNGSSGKQIIVLAGELSFLDSAALMKNAYMNYANDSAPMHLASSVNAPVTAIFCSTVPSFGFGPLSDRSFVVETLEDLPCKPCGLHGFRECPQGHFKCALTIQKEQLLATAIELVPPI